MSSKINKKNQLNIFANDQMIKISRSKIELFCQCPRCFYLEIVGGVKRPAGFPFNLNSAVDKLLKKEFDIHRADQTSHPLMKAYGIMAVVFDHDNLGDWRNNFKGVRFWHEKTNFLVYGAIDDVWQNSAKELIVVDYKATSKKDEVNIDAGWQIGYKRQMEVYQWLLRKNGFSVSDKGYFVYCNGRSDREAFDGKLEFDIKIIPYIGSDAWIEKTLLKIRKVLEAKKLPQANTSCEYCNYRREAGRIENKKI